MFRSVLPDVLQFLPQHLTTHSLLCSSPAIRADMRNDIRLNGSDLTMALAKAAYWERHAKCTHQSVEAGLRHMNDDLEAAKGGRFGADVDSLNEIIVSNGNLIYQSLFNSQQPDLFAEEAEEEEEEVMEEMPVCSICALQPASRVGLRVLGTPVCGSCYLGDMADNMGMRITRRG